MTPKTFDQVRELEQRLAGIHTELARAAAEEERLVGEIATALADGRDATATQRRRAEVRAQRADLAEAAALLAERVETAREEAARAAAEKRLVGIARASGSLSQELDTDDARLADAVATYREAVERLVARWRDLNGLRREAAALADRFGLAAPELPRVGILPQRAAVRDAIAAVAGVGFPDHGHVTEGIERDETGLRTRRTYAEVSGSEGHRIIQHAGLKPWPPLTERQREIVAEREAQAARDRQTGQRMAQEVATVPPRRGAMR